MPSAVRLAVEFTSDFGEVLYELSRLEDPPFMALEGMLATTFAITQARVHVITGGLRASGHPDSSLLDDVWSGAINYARYPGIYELARGPRPTANHPVGSHFFFDPVEGWPDWEDGTGPQMTEDIIMDWVEGKWAK